MITVLYPLGRLIAHSLERLMANTFGQLMAHTSGRLMAYTFNRLMARTSARLMAVTLCTLLAAATPADRPEDQRPTKPLRELWGLLDDPPTSYDPVFASLSADGVIQANLYESLMITNAQGEIIPGAAETVRIEDGGRRYRFTLRRNLRWSDGEQVTARDFQTTLRRMADPSVVAEGLSKSTYLLSWVKNGQAVSGGELPPEALGVRVINPQQLVIEMQQPIGFFNRISANALHPTPTHRLQQQGEGWSQPDQLVSNGPYRLAAIDDEGSLLLSQNPGFHARSSLYFDTVKLFTGDLRRLQTLLATEPIDVAMTYTQTPLRNWLLKTRDLRHSTQQLGMASLLVFNTRDSTVSDVRIRQALQLAAGLDRVVPRIANGDPSIVPSYSLWLPDTAQSTPDANSALQPHWHRWPPRQRLAEARELLAAAGYGPDRPLTLSLHGIDEPTQHSLSNALQNQWAALGIELKPVRKTYTEHYRDIFAGNYQLAFANWRPKFDDPVAMLQLFASNSYNNLPSWQHPPYDQLLQQIYPLPDGAERDRALLQAHRLIWQQVPVITLFFTFDSRALIVEDLVSNPQDRYTQFRYLRRSKAAEAGQQ